MARPSRPTSNGADPGTGTGGVVIRNYLAANKNAAATKAMQNAGCWSLFLPPDSPDLNPIEMAFSKLKAHLRRIGTRTFAELFDAISQICDLFSPEECWSCFRAADYVSG